MFTAHCSKSKVAQKNALKNFKRLRELWKNQI